MARKAVNSTNARQLVETEADRTESSLAEGLGGRLPALSLDIDEGELARNISASIDSGKDLHDDIKEIQDINEKYWQGQQVEGITSKKIRTVENRVFFSIESLISDITARPPEPLIFSDPDDSEFARNVERVLIGKYQDLGLEDVFRQATRTWFLNKISVTKLVHDTATDDMMVTNPRVQRLVFDPNGTDEDNSRFVAELVEEPLGDVLEKFSVKRDEIMKTLDVVAPNIPIDSQTPLKYWEFWTNDFVAWTFGNTIMDSAKNPLWDWENPDNNFLLRPIKPYFFMNHMFTLGKTVYDDTSLVEQVKTVQDSINKTHWDIGEDLSDRGTVVGSGDGISKGELTKYRGEAGAKLWVEKGRPTDSINRLPPKGIHPASLAYHESLRLTSDNTFGTHGTFRGERGAQETFSGRMLLKEQDTGRAGPYAKALEGMATKLYLGMVQYMKLYYTDEKLVPYVDQEGVASLVDILGSNIKRGMKLQVRPGSSLPLDKFVQRNEALELAAMNKIDLISLYEKLGWPKPVESAKRMYIYERVASNAMPADILFPGISAEIAQKLQEAKAAASSVQAAEADIPPEVTQDLSNINTAPGEVPFAPPADEIAAGLAVATGVIPNAQPA